MRCKKGCHLVVALDNDTPNNVEYEASMPDSLKNVLHDKCKVLWDGELCQVHCFTDILNSAVWATTREISKTAMIWALTHVVQPGRSITLLVVIPAQAVHLRPIPWLFFCGYAAPVHLKISLSVNTVLADSTQLCFGLWSPFYLCWFAVQSSGSVVQILVWPIVMYENSAANMEHFPAIGKIQSNCYLSGVPCVLHKLSSDFSGVNSLDAATNESLIVEYSFPPKDQMVCLLGEYFIIAPWIHCPCLNGHTSDMFMLLQLSWLSSVWACSSVVLWYHLHLSVFVGGSDDSDGVHIAATYKVLKLQYQLSPQGVFVKLETLWAPSAWICLVGSRAAKEAAIRVVLYSDLAHC
jgi:hypothetical protein